MLTGFKKKTVMATQLTTNGTVLPLNENGLIDLRDTQKAKRLAVCTFFSPQLINEGNYLGWESTHVDAAAPSGILLLSLPGPSQQQHTAQFPNTTLKPQSIHLKRYTERLLLYYCL